ncbi:MAG: polysaccharide biosynthesis PFTS motif protein [Methanomicrobiales archaeon]|nr:polysaccharide biosynthesis PFTS motif protein [Methanomicrobiales archaeon]
MGDAPGTLILFEQIDGITRPFVLYYLATGRHVGYIRSTGDLAGSRFFGPYLRDGRLSEISSPAYPFRAHLQLNREIPAIAEDHLARDRDASCLLRLMASLAGTSPVELVYRKSLAIEMMTRCRNELQASLWLEGRTIPQPVHYLPGPSPERTASLLGSAAPLAGRNHISSPFWIHALNRIRYLGEKIRWAATLCLFPLWIAVKIGLPTPSEPFPEEYRLGIKVYRTDIGFHGKYRTIDFVLNEPCPGAGETLFCLETEISDDYRHRLAEKGYRVADLRTILRGADTRFIRETVIRKFLPVWSGIALRCYRFSPLQLRRTVEIFAQFLAWEAFFRRYRIRGYLSYNDFLPVTVVRNRILREHGAESFYFIHSTGFHNVFLPPAEGELQTVEFLYLDPDHLVSWGDKVSRVFRSPRNPIGKYEEVGCLWSEMVRNIADSDRAGQIRGDIFRRAAERSGQECGKVIGVYDTSFGKDVPLQAGDLLQFFDDLLVVADRFSEAVFVLKYKLPLDLMVHHCPALEPLLRRIREHPRCFLSRDLGITSEEVIAASDLVIAACFTSPAVEALGARKKALYHDAAGKFRGSYYDGFPRLVAHDREELATLVDYWLYRVSGSEFDRFLDERIQGELEAGVDGKAITRLRGLLCR